MLSEIKVTIFSCIYIGIGDTGEYVWHYQVNPGEQWDYKATGYGDGNAKLKEEIAMFLFRRQPMGFFM